jgi:hypothetical protein
MKSIFVKQIVLAGLFAWLVVACQQANGPDETGGPVRAGPVNAEGLAACLAELPAGTPEQPNTVILDGTVDVSSDAWGTTIKDALAGMEKHIVLDLSACAAGTGNTISGAQEPQGNNFNVIRSEYIVGVILPESLTLVGGRAFYNWSGLAQVVLGPSLETIGPTAFDNALDLAEIIIPAGVKNIMLAAFFGCGNLNRVVFEGTTTAIWSTNSFDDNLKAVYDAQEQKQGAYIRTEGVWSKETAPVQ